MSHQVGEADNPRSGLALVRGLSQYRPFERGGASAREAQEDLLAAALAELGGACPSVPELRSAIKTLFTVDLHQAEVERALGQMIKDQRVVRMHDGPFALTSDEKARLEGVARESDEIAQTALAEWRGYLIDTWPGLTGAQLDQLEDQLRAFLVAVLRRHGAEATELLYPDDAEADRLYSELEAEGFEFQGFVDAEVGAIREEALSHFIRHPSDLQKQFLGQNLNTSYFLTLLSIDPEAAALVREITKGQWVYLDTNFIYRVLGIQGPRYVRATRTILDTTKEVGYRCCVTPWTVDEFKRSLDRARQYLHRYPVPPADYAAILAEATSDEDFVTAYWRQVKSAPAKIDDFYAHWREVEVHLARLGIEIRSEGCKAIEDQGAWRSSRPPLAPWTSA